jgi:lysine-N-methylase
MNAKKRLVLSPRYMQQFSCIGSACEDSCCTGWKVSIDQDTYKKYNRIRDITLKPLIDRNLKRNRSHKSENDFAKIKLDTKGACPFLDTEKLCSIQAKLGEEYLSTVCSTYPRTTNQVNDILEKSATLSCPEIARLALLEPNGIEFDEVEEPVETRNWIRSQIDTSQQAIQNDPRKYLWELRIFTIQTLQNRAYDLADRLIILGMFYQKANEYMTSKKIDDIPQLIALFSNLIAEGSLKPSLDKIPAQTTVQMQLLKELTDYRVALGLNSQRYVDCLRDTLLGIQYTADSKIEDISDRYSHAFETYYSPFISQHEYILENYLVNHVYKNIFPFTNEGGLYANYVMLVIHYSMIKLHLIGMSGLYKDEFGVEHVLKLIQSFSKAVEHSTQYLKQIEELLRLNGFTTLFPSFSVIPS